MKVAVGSDLHLEAGSITLTNTENAKVLLLCGDICVESAISPCDDEYVDFRSIRIHDFFVNCGLEFEHVIYIVGNHEHYRGDFTTTVNNLKEKLGYIPNLHILEKETITIDDITFIGGTLWSDMNSSDPSTMAYIKQSMNDFRIIQNSNNISQYKMYDLDNHMLTKTRPTKFTPYDAIADHKLMLEYIKSVVDPLPNSKGGLKSDARFVVVGHHSPSFQSVSDEFKHDDLMNGGYHSNLDEFIIDRPQIKYWFHGHTHSAHNYVIGNTHIVCNPRGYIGYEEIAKTFKLQYIEIT
jgi:Icc-related predicted phosphoesterase